MMKRQDVEKLELRMKTIRKSLNEDLKELEKTLEKLKEKHMHKEAVDYIISYLQSNINVLRLDIAVFDRTLDREMKECFYYLKENDEERSAPVAESEVLVGTPLGTNTDEDRQGPLCDCLKALMEDVKFMQQCPMMGMCTGIGKKPAVLPE